MKDIIFLLIGAVIIYLAIVIVRALLKFRRAHILGQQAVRAEHVLPNATHKILVIGDSTSYGTGAKDPDASLVGRLIKDYPHSSVQNLSKNAGNVQYVLKVLESITEKYDLIEIHIGGMDAMMFTSAKVLCERLRRMLARAKELAPKVVLVSVNNAGLLPAYLFPLSAIFTYRTHLVSRLSAQVCEEMGVLHVPLWEPKERDLLHNDLSLYAPDGMHPNDKGYAFWYDRIRSTLTRSQ